METGDKLESDVSGFRYEDRKDQGKWGKGSQLLYVVTLEMEAQNAQRRCSCQETINRIDSTAQPASHPVLMNKDKNPYRSPRKYV